MSGFVADVAPAIYFTARGLSPIALDLGFRQLRGYSLAYIAGRLVGWWYRLRLLQAPGAPMARRHADDLVTWATLGIILGGRLAYVLFYDPARFLAHPGDIVKLGEGGMSFHGGAIGVSLALILMARRPKIERQSAV